MIIYFNQRTVTVLKTESEHENRPTVRPLNGEGEAKGMSDTECKSGLFLGPGGGVGSRKGGGRGWLRLGPPRSV